MNRSKILVTGSGGLVGSALIDQLKIFGFKNIVPLTRSSCDLMDFKSVLDFFKKQSPDYVFHTAASVYGIGGNAKNKGAIFYENITINTHVIEACRRSGVRKIVAMGTVAAYPETSKLPLSESDIWNGRPHKSEDSYAHAKRSMLAQLQAYQEEFGLDFAYVVSTNLYGKYDKFNVESGHVVPSLIRKFYEARKSDSVVAVWGDGSASRDFLYSVDLARALILILERFSGVINVGSSDVTNIKEIVEIIAGYYQMKERFFWDTGKPNGRSFCQMDLSLLRNLGFKTSYSLTEGLLETLEWYDFASEKGLVRN